MSQTMNTPAGLGKTWAGKVVDRKFPLRQWLGGSDHSTVFLTERPGARKATIKLIPAKNLDEDAQLSRWASIAKLSHPHLMQLFEWGRCQIDGTRLLYVVMECAEENLGEVLPVYGSVQSLRFLNRCRDSERNREVCRFPNSA